MFWIALSPPRASVARRHRSRPGAVAGLIASVRERRAGGSGVPEADDPLHRPLEGLLGGRERQPLEAVFGVVVRAGAEPLLELRQRGRASGVAHVVVLASVIARLLDGQAEEEVVGAGAPQRLVH